MQAMDGRALSREALHERQRQIIRGFNRGQSKAAISRDLGVSYSAVCRRLDRYARAGERALVTDEQAKQHRKVQLARLDLQIAQEALALHPKPTADDAARRLRDELGPGLIRSDPDIAA